MIISIGVVCELAFFKLKITLVFLVTLIYTYVVRIYATDFSDFILVDILLKKEFNNCFYKVLIAVLLFTIINTMNFSFHTHYNVYIFKIRAIETFICI